MTDKEIQEMIKRHEGYRDRVYIDAVGVPTGGYGHAFLSGSPLPAVVCDILFYIDYWQSVQDYEILTNREGFELDPIRRGVVINMIFNLGLFKLMKFKKMLTALSNKDWNRAADEMKNSKWYSQVGKRGKELVKLMRKGEL